MGLFSAKLNYDHGGNIRDRRKGKRRPMGGQAWVRLGSNFSVRPCKVVEMSTSGVRIKFDNAEGVPAEFTLMTSRNDPRGRRVKIRWRQGKQVGAEFF